MPVSFFPAVFYPAGSDPYGIAAADFNGDGDMDLAITVISSGDIAVLLGNGDGTFYSIVPLLKLATCLALYAFLK